MPTVIERTIGTGGYYPTIAAWESGSQKDLVAADEVQVGVLLNQVHVISSAVVIAGAVSDADHYRVLRAESGAAYDLIAGTGVKIEQQANTYGVLVQEEGVRLEGFAVAMTAASHGSTAGIATSNDGVNANGTSVLISRCAVLDQTGVSTGSGFWVIGGGYATILTECIVVGKGTSTFGYGIRNSSNASAIGPEYNNCVVYECGFNGIQSSRDIASFKMRNCVAAGCTTDISLLGTSNAVIQNNASSDGSAVGAGAVTGFTPGTAWADPANGDFTPLATDTELRGAGVDLSAEFQADFRGWPWTLPWNIGAYSSPFPGPTEQSDLRAFQALQSSLRAGQSVQANLRI